MKTCWKKPFALLLCILLLLGPISAAALSEAEPDITSEPIEEAVGEAGDFGDTGLTGEVEDAPEAIDIPIPAPDAEEATDEASTEFSEDQIEGNASTDVTVGDYTYNFDDGGGVIVSYNGSAAQLEIPSTVDYDGRTYKIVKIAADAFSDHTTLESVVIPASIKSMGYRVFKNCTNLNSVTINGNLADYDSNCISTNIYHPYSDYSPFYCAGSYADSLTITFGDEVTRIPDYVFATASSKSDNCYAHITKLVIGDNVTYIGSHAFYSCYDLKEIVWGKELLNIGSFAFCYDTGLTTFELPAKLYSIGEGAFYGCENLDDVRFPESLKTIDSHAFEECTFMTKVVLPSSLLSIGYTTFKNCTHLSSITINSNLADFDDHCTSTNVYYPYSIYSPFYCAGTYADSLTITFGTGVTKIPNYLFATASSSSDNYYAHVTKVVMADTIITVGDHAFYNCYDLKDIVWSSDLRNILGYAFANNIALTEVALPEKTDNIGKSAFYGCNHLAIVTLPASIATLGDTAFKHCTRLNQLTINGNLSDSNERCISTNVYHPYSDYSPFYCAGLYSDTFNVTFGSGVKRIPGYIFATVSSKEDGNYCHVKSLTIPASVTEVGDYAFYYCHDLASVSYAGSQADWSAVTVGTGNDALTGAAFTYGGGSAIPVTGITLSQTALALAPGQAATLTATVAPTDATEQGVIWSSSDPAVASAKDGVVTAVATGQATITAASAADSAISATCTVTVTPSAVSVTGIKLDNTQLILTKGDTATLTATIEPSDASDTVVLWSSGNSSVATVVGGVVTAVTNGYALVTATASGDPTKAAVCAVMVVDPDATRKQLNRAGANGKVKLNIGDKLQLIPSYAAKRGWTVLGYATSAKRCATVTSGGLVTAKRAGDATITVTTAEGGKATLIIRVIDPKTPTKVALDHRGTVRLKVGDTLQLNATLSPATAVSKLTWRSSNKSVATVSRNGLVKAKRKGTAIITVTTKNGKTTKVKIKVAR